MRTRRPVLAFLTMLLGCAGSQAQQITADDVGKAPPGAVPGGGIQLDVYNLTTALRQLRVRAPGENWFLLDIPPNGGRNLRCTVCREYLEAVLPDGEAPPRILRPGTAYEIRQDRRGDLALLPRGRAQ
ncbi:hypothetical protein E2C06_02395 [Dankookia rubra]|uniref:Uncharacterized protein n=1 Tax=Dankookia rubra TaxID=1442381 RepID=A0A4V3AC51_9PROT|nr:hypothetical protein [Dankookia rubra]TDH64215.1 hypothetical protein E2C06_02395 [Dankookia rubra]